MEILDEVRYDLILWESPTLKYGGMQTCYFNLFLLDDSVVLKVITIYNKDTDTMEEVLLEELQVFKVCHLSVECV